MLNQKLEYKLLQKLSPQQIQIIKLLEVPTIQLDQRIKKEMEDNPTLEEGADDEFNNPDEESIKDEKEQDEFSLEDYMNNEDIPMYRLSSKNYSQNEKHEDIPFSIGVTFIENLKNQLGLRKLTDKQKFLADYLLGNIDEDGYLRRELSDIVNDLAFSQNISTTENRLIEVLKIIQDLEPVGVGSRNLKECLYLQIISKNQELLEIQTAKEIIENYFEEFTKKHYDKIKDKMNLSDDDLKSAIDEIIKLNPKPGSSFNDPNNKTFQYILPDFILENDDDELILSLNSKNVPELRISRTYTEMLESYSENKKNRSKEQKNAITFVKHKLDSAKWFIEAIKQRQNTLLNTMNAIIEYQKEYFLNGEEIYLKPMILKTIAEKTNLDISTISRVANSKYIQTPFGTFPLKFFFSEGMQKESGEEVSTREIKKILQDCIDLESKTKPLTDEKLVGLLKEKGYNIARRTIAKYREQLNIPVARLRKEL